MSVAIACEDLSVVIVDDDHEHRNLIQASLESLRETSGTIHVSGYDEPDIALASLPPDGNVVVLIDYHLKGTSGLEWLNDFAKSGVGPIIVMTSAGDEQIAADAFRKGAADYLDKQEFIHDPMRLWTSIKGAHRRFRLEHTNQELARSLKLANAELRSKNEKLADLTQNAQQFVEDVAHEFRTPLTVIKEFASILNDGIGGEITSKQCQYLDFISSATSDLASLVDDFLDCGKLRTGMLHVNRERISPRDVLDESWPMIESRANDKGVVLEKVCPENLPTVYGDSEKAGRALLNLVTNAIKFSNHGDKVIVRSTQAGDCVRFEVQDHGPGLAPEEVECLFQRFHQCEQAKRISDKGFGLGLSIVRDLVCINLGQINIESALGEGSTFSFTLPTFNERSIAEAFARRAKERDPAVPVSVLAVYRPEADPGHIDDLHSFLTSICYGADLVLPAADGSRVVVVGQTSKPDRWATRIEAADHKRQEEGVKESEHPLEIDAIGIWKPEDAAKGIAHAVGSLAKGETDG